MAPSALSWIGSMALIVLLTAAQAMFLATHRRRYGLWRSTMLGLWASRDERRLMWKAITHRDPDGRVELSRLVLIAVAVLVFVGLFVLVPMRN
jgi:hypothetical protein